MSFTFCVPLNFYMNNMSCFCHFSVLLSFYGNCMENSKDQISHEKNNVGYKYRKNRYLQNMYF